MKSNNISFLSIIFFLAFTFNACTKANLTDDVIMGDPPPVAGGFTNSSQVASGNLLAYWNFDGSNKEIKSNTAPGIVSNASFTTGIKGQALHLSSGYLLYPTIAALSSANSVASCSVSLWMKVANNGSYFSELFTLARDTATENDWLTIINVGVETGHNASDQNLDLHSWIGSYPTGSRRGGDNINDYGNVGVDYQTVNGANQWIHYVMRYDAATENIDLFANNIRVSNNNFRHRGGLGPLISPVPTQVVIGGFSNTTTNFSKSSTLGFHGLLNGDIDELRVFNKALTDVEITALFKLEKQGR